MVQVRRFLFRGWGARDLESGVNKFCDSDLSRGNYVLNILRDRYQTISNILGANLNVDKYNIMDIFFNSLI